MWSDGGNTNSTSNATNFQHRRSYSNTVVLYGVSSARADTSVLHNPSSAAVGIGVSIGGSIGIGGSEVLSYTRARANWSSVGRSADGRLPLSAVGTAKTNYTAYDAAIKPSS